MTHPKDKLLDYVLGDLSEQEQVLLETHLRECESCLQELRALQQTVIALSEAVPAAQAPANTWQNLQRHIQNKAPRPPREIPAKPGLWQGLALVTSLFLILTAVLWGYQQQKNYQLVLAEQRKVAGWLSRPDVSSQPLLSNQGERLGSVLTLSDGRALFVLRNPPQKGLSYQAWGSSNGQRVSLGLSERSLLEVVYEGYEFIGISLEPKGGNDAPSQPLGRVPTS